MNANPFGQDFGPLGGVGTVSLGTASVSVTARATQSSVREPGSQFFKAVRPDGTDFHSGETRWLPADGTPIPDNGWLVEHPHPGEFGDSWAQGYLSVSVLPTDCTGFEWPGRLLVVESVSPFWTPEDALPTERAAHAWRVVSELEPWRLFGPQGRTVVAIIDRAEHLTVAEIEDLATAWDAARDAARAAARDAAWRAAQDSARDAAWDAAEDAAPDAVWRVAQDAAWLAARSAAWRAALGAALGAAQDSAQDAVLGALVADVVTPDTLRCLVDPWESVIGAVIA